MGSDSSIIKRHFWSAVAATFRSSLGTVFRIYSELLSGWIAVVAIWPDWWTDDTFWKESFPCSANVSPAPVEPRLEWPSAVNPRSPGGADKQRPLPEIVGGLLGHAL